MNEKNDTTLFGYHVVCIIDVLDQEQKLAQWARLPEDGQLPCEFRTYLQQTVGAVLFFRDQFLGFFNQFEQQQSRSFSNKFAGLSMQLQEHYQRFRDCCVKVQRFSDSFVFNSQIGNGHGDASVMPMFITLATCCQAMMVSLAAKLPVRGAITVGAGAVLEDGGFYGPALAQAHYLESKVAGYPRIVIAPAAMDFLADGQAYSADRKIAELMNQMACVCRSLICRDTDGIWIVDFLGEGLRALIGSTQVASDAVRMAYQFVQTETNRLQVARDAKLAPRYKLLLDYMDSRLPPWCIQ